MKIKRIAVPIVSSKPCLRSVKKNIQVLREYGVEVLISPLLSELLRKDHERKSDDCEFGKPEERARDIHWALDQRADLIICACGGSGAGRVIRLIQKRKILDSYTPIMGFSDCTHLLNLWASLGVRAFSGPCFEDSHEYILKAIKHIEEEKPSIISAETARFINIYNDFRVRGLFGQNLTCFISALVNSKLSEAQAFIFEDIFCDYGRKGAEYSFESVLDVIEAFGIFDKVTLWGTITNVRNSNSHIEKRIKRPAALNLPYGHFSKNYWMPIPLGYDIMVEIIPSKKAVKIYEQKSKKIFNKVWNNEERNRTRKLMKLE